MQPNKEIGLFQTYKSCTVCGKKLPDTYVYDYCPKCKDIKLLHDVKDFIRENDVNEYQVADFFDIPVSQVKGWIRDGHIEYRLRGENNSFSMHCQRCGATISFGSLCTQCIKLLNGSKKGFSTDIASSDNRMRFLDHEN